MTKAGWQVLRSEAGVPRLRDPDGQMWVRALVGRPQMEFVQDDGTVVFLRKTFRSARTLLSMMGVSHNPRSV